MPIAVIILVIALLAIALRKVIKFVIPIWLIMAVGGIAVVLLQQITPKHALLAIEPDVLLYLFGIFFISQAAEECGYLEYLTDKLFLRANTGKHALFIIIFILGLSSALLMNDTIAIVGTPIILQLCKKHKELMIPLLLALAFSITIGSVMTPIGNPQNLLIAIKSEMTHPFSSFIKPLFIPTVINLIITYFFLSFVYRKILNQTISKPEPQIIHDHQTVKLVKISLAMIIVLLLLKVIIDFVYTLPSTSFSYIMLISALPIFLSKQRGRFLRNLDWGTLIFFASTFIIVQSVWNSGFLQESITKFNIPITHIAIIIVVSIILSQFISNVPLVALYLPVLLIHQVPNANLLALAVGSTIAGNLSILGAASNVIIIQNMEKRKIAGFGFLQFMKLGLPLTVVNISVYIGFLYY